ncbi:MAG: hypothetical protein IH949_10655 [Bacteroidetes bacterium]|nr:hypothetical protein [Bacteroidota bacterium]
MKETRLNELFRALASREREFQKWFCNEWSYNLFIVSTITELLSDYKKYLRGKKP